MPQCGSRRDTCFGFGSKPTAKHHSTTWCQQVQRAATKPCTKPPEANHRQNLVTYYPPSVGLSLLSRCMHHYLPQRARIIHDSSGQTSVNYLTPNAVLMLMRMSLFTTCTTAVASSHSRAGPSHQVNGVTCLLNANLGIYRYLSDTYNALAQTSCAGLTNTSGGEHWKVVEMWNAPPWTATAPRSTLRSTERDRKPFPTELTQ